MANGRISYGMRDNACIINFSGEIRCVLSPALDSYLEKLFAEPDVNDITIDLTETECIDSTILGLLAKIANFMQDRFAKRATIVSVNEDINRFLECVGFDDEFIIVDQTEGPEWDKQTLTTIEPAVHPTAGMILDAHLNLSALNETNREMFKDVVEKLSSE
jgi:anti-anti-sigma factor